MANKYPQHKPTCIHASFYGKHCELPASPLGAHGWLCASHLHDQDTHVRRTLPKPPSTPSDEDNLLAFIIGQDGGRPFVWRGYPNARFKEEVIP